MYSYPELTPVYDVGEPIIEIAGTPHGSLRPEGCDLSDALGESRVRGVGEVEAALDQRENHLAGSGDEELNDGVHWRLLKIVGRNTETGAHNCVTDDTQIIT